MSCAKRWPTQMFLTPFRWPCPMAVGKHRSRTAMGRLVITLGTSPTCLGRSLVDQWGCLSAGRRNSHLGSHAAECGGFVDGRGRVWVTSRRSLLDICWPRICPPWTCQAVYAQDVWTVYGNREDGPLGMAAPRAPHREKAGPCRAWSLVLSPGGFQVSTLSSGGAHDGHHELRR